MTMRVRNVFSLSVFLTLFAISQAPAQRDLAFEPPKQERVQETLAFLASDDLAGRDTPSRGLRAAADHIEERFRKAGLEPGVGKSFRHHWTLSGKTADTRSARLTVRVDDQTRVLEPVKDFRIWEAAGPVEDMDAEPYLVSRIDPERNSKQEGDWRSRPLFVEVDPESPLWREADETRSFLSRRPRRAIVVVRDGVLSANARVDLVVPDVISEEIQVDNVVGIVRGTKRPDEFVLVTAHYDHVGVQLAGTQEDVVYNGADDDATGTTAVITLAEALAHTKPARSIVFCCVSGEEKGLLGSRALAADPPFDLAKVVVNVNLEMIGRPPETGRFQAWITGDDLSNFREVVAPELARARVETIDFRMGAMLFRASDNYSFAAKGIVAHSISAGSLHEDYHKPSDEVSKIDFEHMTRVIEGIGNVIAKCCDPDVTFAYNERGKQQIGGGGRRRGRR